MERARQIEREREKRGIGMGERTKHIAKGTGVDGQREERGQELI